MSLQHEHSLSDLQNKLHHWRQSRPGGRIPAEIKTQAVALLEHHKVSAIINALGINSKMFQQWRQQFSSLPNHSDTAFVMLPQLPSQVPELDLEATFPLKVSLSRAEGAVVSLEGQLSLEQWSAALSLLQQQECRI